MLNIRNLHASVEGKRILNGLNLEVKSGEVHAIMGPNGSGKSTLAQVLAGREAFEVTEGSVDWDGVDLLAMPTEERARAGLFLAFQYPVEIPGVSNAYFLKAAVNAIRRQRGLDEYDAMDFLARVKAEMKAVGMKEEFLYRSVNEGFSGGEKVAGLAIAANKVAQGAATSGNGGDKRLTHRLHQPRTAARAECPGWLQRMNTGTKQALGRIDVAHADDPMTVHQHVLYRRPQPARDPVQPIGAERLVERLRPQSCQQGMLPSLARLPNHQAETARITQTQGLRTKDQIDMVVRPGRLAGINDAQAARHAKMHDQRTVAKIEQQVLRPSRHPKQRVPLDLVRQIGRHRQAQAGVAHHQGVEHAAFDMRPHTAAGGLDFG